MTGFEEFILAALILVFLAGVHRRIERTRLIKRLTDKGYTADDISEVLGTYTYEEDDNQGE